jgi:hypothetical protein
LVSVTKIRIAHSGVSVQQWQSCVSDDANGATIAAIVVVAIFWAALFVFLTVASSGWGVILARLMALVRGVTSSLVLVGSLYILRYCDIGLWAPLLVVTLAGALFVLFCQVRDHTQHAQTEIKAHLLVIANDGIEPTTTPIYAKYRRYVGFFGLALGATVVLAIAVIAFAFVGAPTGSSCS